MTDHNMAISLSNHSPSSDSSSSSGRRTLPNSSSSHHHRRPPAPPSSAIIHHQNQPQQQHHLLMTPPSKKPRGRPPGSKNKPKAPMVITQTTDPAFKPVIITVPRGTDVVEAVINYARRRHVSISILSASGVVTSVTLRHALSQAPAFTVHGPFGLMSLSGTFLYNYPSAPPSSPNLTFGINLSGSQGQVITGIVGGKVVAGNEVTVTASVFRNAEVYKVIDDDEGDEGDDNDNNDKDDHVNNNNNINNDNNNNPNACEHGGNENMSGFNVVSCQMPGW